MLIAQLISNPLQAVFFLLSIVAAVSVHEYAHAKAADLLGDPTPELAGRLTLNPKSHLDPVGSILFLLIGFGWGKPVPFDPFNLKDPRKDAGIISLAGPLSNFILAILCALLIRLFLLFELSYFSTIGVVFLEIFIWINIVLGFFNLIPIHPLDGFKIVGAVLSEKGAEQWYELQRYGIVFLVFVLFPFVGNKSMLDIFIVPLLNGISNILIP